ncbi:cytochrome P450 [Cubamyces lactineus]|nr:cytochrome P450 [Cubamyces lactineus]
MTSAGGLAFLAALLVLALSYLWCNRSNRRRLPGPKPKVIIGNLTDLPSGGHEWIQYAAMARKYVSDVLYFTALGTPLLVINSFEAARELLDKRGATYSDRPRLVMIRELMEWDWNVILMSYGKRFSAYRRAVQQEFQPAVIAQSYHQVMAREVTAFLARVLDTPDNLVDHLKHMTGAIIMMVTYGHQVQSMDDPFIVMNEAVREHAEARPGVALVDVFPILKYLPTWFPGASFHRAAAIGRELSMKMRVEPYNMIKATMDSGNAIPCMATRLLSQDPPPEEANNDEFVKNCCAVVYSAGADTTAAALRNFTLAMIVYPDVQRRAQEELDRVLGRDRLPTFQDQEKLPYVSTIMKESLRWRAMSPLGVPHATLKDDEYKGGYVPKGTTVLANIYAILHDESVYSNPDEFDPDRYLPTREKPEGEPDPARAAFGFGRRICPGRFFAEDSLFLTIASMLHVFTISHPNGLSGGEAMKGIIWSSGLVSHPSAFAVQLTPRFQYASDVVHAAQMS